MFFRKKKENEDLKAEARESMESFLHDIYYEIEAQRQIAEKTGLFTNKEFAQYMEDTLNEASEFYDDMNPDEIMAERIGNKIKKIIGADDMEVVKVGL